MCHGAHSQSERRPIVNRQFDHVVVGVFDTGAGRTDTQINAINGAEKVSDTPTREAVAGTEPELVPVDYLAGTGLGLSIVQSLAQARGGTLQASRGPGGGAGMILTFPLHSPSAVGPFVPRIAAESIRDTENVDKGLMRFFGVNRAEDIEVLPHAARKTAVNSEATPAQIAWLYRVKQMATGIFTKPYSKQALIAALPKLKALALSPEGVAQVPRILAECGIRFVVVETLPAAKIDGVCFWINPGAPVIGMTLRFDRIDNFWFVLRHEIEHVLQGHGMSSVVLDTGLEGDRAGTGPDVNDEERVANQAAQDFLVPTHQLDAFIARKAPFFSERDLVGFAKIMRVHPGIVAGQLQRQTNRYDRFRDHLAKIRANILPNVFKDGWGDVAPIEQ